MSVVLQHDSRVNVTYAYHNEVLWDKERKASKSKRTLIGRIDPITGEITPTAGRRRKEPADEALFLPEIEAYNKKVREKRRCAEVGFTPEGEKLESLSRKYDELLSKYQEISELLKAFALSINETLTS